MKPVTYVYCYDCKRVLGKPAYTLKAVKQAINENHKGHIITQSDWDRTVKERKNNET